MKKVFLGALVAVATLALAAQGARELFVNGKKSAVAVIEQDGQIYVPLSALREAGADVTLTDQRLSIQFVPPKGQTQVDAIEGVIGEYVNNETWRVKVHEVTKVPNPFTKRGPGYRVVLEVRNLAAQAAGLHGSGLDNIQLIDKSGQIFAVTGGSFKDRYTSVPAAGSFTNELLFGPQGQVDSSEDADKLLILFRSFGGKPLKNIRIFLKPE